MATWAKCSDLFLYTKGNDVYLWRCNKTIWMPMMSVNFEDLGKVTDYVDLIGGKDSILEWDKSFYNNLVAYISPRRLLVNSSGLVIAELGTYDQDGKLEENELPFYIRLLDVLSLKPFGLRERTIPLRTVRYMEAEGRSAPVEDSTTTTTTTELDDEKRAVAELKAANKTLKSDKEVADKQVSELKETNKILKSEKEVGEKQETELKDGKKDLVEDVAAQKTVARNAQQERDEAKRDKEAAEKQVAKLKETKKTLKMDKEAAEKKAVDLQTKIDVINEKKEIWMNNFTDEMDIWNIVPSLRVLDATYKIDFVYERGELFPKDDDHTTNVRGNYLYYATIRDRFDNLIGRYTKYKVVRLNDLNPSERKARFTQDWSQVMHNGDLCVIKYRI